MARTPGHAFFVSEGLVSGMNDGNSNNHTRDWSAYWSTGALTSLSEDFAGVYDGEIAGFWHDQCRALARQASIADLCSGNGAVALLIADWAARHARQWKIAAVDAADLDPGLIAAAWPQYRKQVERIAWHGRQPVETFKAGAQSHDLLTSQYGLEYTNWRASARQVVRLLKPGGRLAMINHAPDTDIMATMKEEQADYRRLDDSGATGLMASWLAGATGLDELRGQLQAPERVLQQQAERTGSPLLGSVANTMGALRRAPREQIEPRRAGLSQWLEHLAAAWGRLDNMIAVNLAIQARPDWINVFVEAGMRLTVDKPVLYAGRHMAGRARVLVKT